MNSKYANLTPEERLRKISDILIKGIYLLAEDEGWIDKPKKRYSAYPKKEKIEIPLIQDNGDSEITEPERYYSLTEASKLMGVSKRTMQRWVEKGKIKAEKGENGYFRVLGSNLSGFGDL